MRRFGTEPIEEFKEDLEEEDLALSFLPFVQFNLGMKGKITENIHLMSTQGSGPDSACAAALPASCDFRFRTCVSSFVILDDRM